MEKIVVYTGSFNPPTKAHFALMNRAMEVVDATKGIFLPTSDSHVREKMINKMERLALNATDRIAMLKTFCDKNKNVEICDYEVRTDDSNSTYKTFSKIKSNYDDAIIYYVMGADKLKSLPKWKNVNKFLNEFKFIVFDRADLNAYQMIIKDELLSKYIDNFIIVPPLANLKKVSSTLIRNMFLNKDESYKDYVTEDVSNIMEHINLNDYNEITPYDFIKLNLNKGPFNVVKALRCVYKLNKDLFNENKSLNDISDVELLDNNINKNIINNNYETKVIIEDDAYDSLVKKYNNSIIIVESSKERVCSYYDQGGNDSLEEELARVTNLSRSLYRVGNSNLKCVKESLINKTNIYPINNSLLVKNVRFIRNGRKFNYKLLDHFDTKCDMILVPSLCLFKKDNYKLKDLNYLENDRLNSDGINIMKNKLRNAFNKALNLKYDNIIINAFGNGFYVPLQDCSIILNDIIKEYDGYFKNIIINGSLKGKMKKEFLDNIKKGE